MKIGELISELKNYDEGSEVLFSCDEEGNAFMEEAFTKSVFNMRGKEVCLLYPFKDVGYDVEDEFYEV